MSSTAVDELYAARLGRYVTAMRNGTPDRVPLRPLAAEITARYAGFTCQEVTHDYNKAFEAVIRCCHDFEWDAVVPNMVYVWTGLTDAIGLRYYGVPGIHVGPDVGFQYREPSEAGAFMKREEYDAPSAHVPPPLITPGIPAWVTAPKVRPGICFPFEEKYGEPPPISGDVKLVRDVWDNIEGLAYLYIWHVLLSF